MARAGMLGFFGAAGLDLAVTEAAIDRLKLNLGSLPFGVNLIHSPNEPAREAATVDLYLRKGVRLVEAAAYLQLTLPVVRFRVTGIHQNAQGQIVTPNRIMETVLLIIQSTFHNQPQQHHAPFSPRLLPTFPLRRPVTLYSSHSKG